MRIQLDLQEPSVKLLELLKRKTGYTTYKELFNCAITLLHWALRQREMGLMICAVDKAGGVLRELHMPGLELSSPGDQDLLDVSA